MDKMPSESRIRLRKCLIPSSKETRKSIPKICHRHCHHGLHLRLVGRRSVAKRSLTNEFHVPNAIKKVNKREIKRSIGGSFGGRKSKEARPDESPYTSVMIQSTSAERASVLLGNGSLVIASTGELLPANPDILEGVDDLIQLSYLNEPSVLHNLHFRFTHDAFYSKAGTVLIAINPFKKLKLYGSEYVTTYRQKLMDSPHVYAIADTAYSEMMRDEVNQSLIIR